MNKFKEGTVVVIKQITELGKELEIENEVPYNLITEIRTFYYSFEGISVICVLGKNKKHYSIKKMISVMKTATDREAFLYHLKGRPFVLKE